MGAEGERGHLFQVHAALSVGGDDLGCQLGELDALAHELHGDAESLGDFVHGVAFADEAIEGLELLHGVHGRALMVFGQAAGHAGAVEHAAGDGLILGKVAVVAQQLQGSQSAAAGLDQPAAAVLGDG